MFLHGQKVGLLSQCDFYVMYIVNRMYVFGGSCFRCKQVEPKVEGFPEEYRSDGIGFYSIDVESVDDAEVLPQDVCVIPMFLVYNQGVLRESVRVPQKRPARSVAQALKRVFHLPHSQD